MIKNDLFTKAVKFMCYAVVVGVFQRHLTVIQ